MSDIFLSYESYDTEKAYRLSTLFHQQGWSVWSAPPILPPGVYYDEEGKREIKGARVIVALWSHAASVLATVREDLKQITPALPVFVLLEKVEPPPEFMPIRAFDLSEWDGAESHAGLQNLLWHLRALIAASQPQAAPPVSIMELSLSEIQENARRGIQEGMRARGETRFSGVFISYRRNEAAAYAGRLYDRLVARFGREKVFIDTENVGWGEDFVEAITEAADSCAVMIALISPRWARGGQEEPDDYVRLEVSKALGRKIRVVPILIQGASMPAAQELTEDLAPLVRRNALALSDARWERDVEDLLKTLESFLKD